MPTDELMIETLAKAAGWHPMGENWRSGVPGIDGKTRMPSRDLNDARALRLALEAREGWDGPTFRLSLGRQFNQMCTWQAATLSAADLCRAMFAALPDCLGCKGTGKVPHCSIPKHGDKPCPACDGYGKKAK